MLETLIAAIILASLIIYALMGGADYGGGMWDLLASGENYSKRRGTGVDTEAFIVRSGSGRGGPVAVTSLPLSDFQTSRTAVTFYP